MKITKYEHACLLIEEGEDKLVVDPGDFSKSFSDYSGVCAIVITHIHQDHYGVTHIKALQSANPNLQIFGTDEVIKALGAGEVVTGGMSKKAGAIKLDFYGGEHAVIHSSVPTNHNVGVMINDKLYYPGDSFTEPNKPVEVLAIPASAPWMKIGEAMDFLKAVKPLRAFPTHDVLLSDIGAGISNRWLSGAAEAIGCTYSPIENGSQIEV